MTTAEYLATCGSGGGGGGGGGGGERGGVGQRETRRSGTNKLVVPAMFAPNPEVLARRAQRERKRDAAAMREGSDGASGAEAGGGGGIVETPAVVANVNSGNRCCCEAEDCLNDVSGSQHYCSVTKRRVFAWCQTEAIDERFDSITPCIRCAGKQHRKG